MTSSSSRRTPAGGGLSASAAPSARVRFAPLDRAAAEALLRRHTVGRIAFTFHDRVSIEPINYVFEDGWLYGRTSPGTKLATLAHHPWVAFEVDEEHATLDWDSVVVHGTFYIVDPEGAPIERSVWPRAVELLRTLVPSTFTPDDPVAFRDVVFRISADEIDGRTSRVG